jgi:uncharacterized protein YkwD
MVNHRIQRLTSVALALALLLPASTFAENRGSRRTSADELAVEMERVFGAKRTRPASVSRPASVPALPTAAGTLVNAMNRQRAAHGLGPLRLNAKLSQAAGDRIGDMFAKHYFAHVSPDGIDPFDWVEQRGYRYRLVGENLAVGYRGTAVVDGWMRSPGHRENILQSGFDEVGIAIADGSPRRGYKGPTVVAIYGRR